MEMKGQSRSLENSVRKLAHHLSTPRSYAPNSSFRGTPPSARTGADRQDAAAMEKIGADLDEACHNALRKE